jgi:hypothetical protein
MTTTRHSPSTPFIALAAVLSACGGAPQAQRTPEAVAVEPTSPAATAEVAPAESVTPEAHSSPAPATDATSSDEGPCDLVCEDAQVEDRKDGKEELSRISKNANEVLLKIRPAMLACYEKRIVAKPQAHAFMTFSVLVGPDGHVRDVETTGGALLGDKTISCLVGHVRGAVFERPKGGGSLRLNVPFTLRRVPANASK